MEEKNVLKEEYYLWLLNAIKEANGYYETNDSDLRLNRTEIALLNVVRFKTAAGEKVISTQIADYLNVTRSAVSQTVNKLEERGYIRRVSSERDKKIFYVCLSEREQVKFDEQTERNRVVLERAAAEMGEKDMREFNFLSGKFFSILQNERKEVK